MASISSALAISRSPLPLPAHSSRFKRAPVISIKYSSDPSPEPDPEAPLKGSSLLGISTNSWCAGLGTLGFLETGYLSYLKLTNSEAFCAVGGGSCRDVLNSDYSSVFGVPLPVIGMMAYGFVALLSLEQTRKNLLSVVGETDIRLILLGTTTSMATASAYFLYLLSTKLAGSFCSYCFMSAILSFSLFFITLRDFGLETIQKAMGIQLVTALVIIAALSTSYMDVPQFSRCKSTTTMLHQISDQSRQEAQE
ncbi:thiol-disulfide oxidoreductase LTO1-like [Asparagus officinalis]|uniref:thiol-disulfide oxidoreductase LTO1-like n=1 Tax=Asparagus officinalis TaxID=4686 RepID=UPI00098E6300|nr:thiol-disulfide oxidoreductase LTO1-like [Asparagus officinalis]